MSVTTKATRKMRIIAIPLTRPKPASTQHATASKVLTYYQFQLRSPHPPPPSSDVKAGGSSLASRWLPEEGVANWVTGKANNIWGGFGKAKGGWKLKLYHAGEKLVDRLDFEELALKGIDPSVGPSITHPTSTSEVEGAETEKLLKLSIPLIYPSSLSNDSAVMSELRSLLEYRTLRHRKGFYTWMIIAPFTAPFMIIPIIPNIPFFFCAWRSWSHYRAYRSSQYLQSLIDADAIIPEASEPLDAIYKQFTPASSPPPSSKSTPSEKEDPPTSSNQHSLLLTRAAVPTIIDLFQLRSNAENDLYRAVEQARLRVESGRLDL